MSRDLPKVSALVPVYNYARFVEQSLESALTQEYPPELLEIIVVDDGSTDNSVDVVRGVMSRHAGRIKLVEQRNSGQVATVARAAAEATGELLAFLDADDVWLPQKTAKQVDAYLAEPNVGLIFSDMQIVDADGRVSAESLYEPGEPDMDPVRLYARVLRSNIIFNSSSMHRADMLGEAPPEIEAWDWLLAVRATAMRALGRLQVAYVPEVLAQYRRHGENMLFGSTGAKLIGMRRRQLRFQLWAIRNVDLTPLGPAELSFVWGGAEWFATTASEATGSRFIDLVSVSEEERGHAQARRAAALEAGDRGDLWAQARLLLEALAWDPHSPEVFRLFEAAVRRARDAEAVPHPLRAARPFVVLVDAAELLGDDHVLLEYAAQMAGMETVTLAVETDGLTHDEAAEALSALVERCGLGDRDDIDILAMVEPLDAAQRHRVRTAASARYLASSRATDDHLPWFTPARLSELRELASAWDRSVPSDRPTADQAP